MVDLHIGDLAGVAAEHAAACDDVGTGARQASRPGVLRFDATMRGRARARSAAWFRHRGRQRLVDLRGCELVGGVEIGIMLERRRRSLPAPLSGVLP